MRFPIVPLEQGVKVPDENCYVVGSNGIFVRKVGPIESLAPLKGVSGLEEVRPYVRLNTGKIPLMQFHKTLAFFRAVYDRYHSEAAVQLFYSKTGNTFLVYAPPQEVSDVSAVCDAQKRFPGYIKIGIIHSHGEHCAAPSSQDRRDEYGSYGLHIIVGCVRFRYVDINAHITVRGGSVDVPPEDVIDGLRRVGSRYPRFCIDPARGQELADVTFSSKWMRRVKPPVPRWLTEEARRRKHARS